MDDLHDCILKLNDCIKDKKNEDNTSLFLIQSVTKICLHSALAEKDLLYACSLILKKENGLLHFLSESVNISKFKSSQCEALEFLNLFIDKIESKVVQYGINIKDVAFSVFVRDQTAKTKCLALSILSKVLRLCSGKITSECFNLQKLIDMLIPYIGHSKTVPLVKQQLFYFLGISSRYYPDLMQSYSERLLNWYINELKLRIESNYRFEASTVAGCLQGINEFMYQFPVRDTEDIDKAYQLFNFVRIILKKFDVKRYELAKASMEILSSHAVLLAQFLYEDSIDMYNILESWIKHGNRAVRFSGFDALDAVLKQISEKLEQNYKENTTNTTVFKFFIEKFQQMMHSSDDFRCISTAIRGFGNFAKVCKLYLTEDDVKFMLNDVIKKSEQHCLNENSPVDERIQILPGFLESLSSIIIHLKEISENSLNYLEKLAVFQIEHFPYLPSPLHFLSYNSLIKLFSAIYSKGPQFKNFVNKVLYQGIIRTCSYPVSFEVEAKKKEIDETDLQIKNPRVITCKSYSILWDNLLKFVGNKQLKHFDVSLEDQHNILQLVYDEIISIVLSILRKLDLTTSYSIQNNQINNENQFDISDVYSTVSNPFYGLQPSKPKDFQIFINIVEFCKELLLKQHFALFEKWILIYGLDIIQYINKNPYISGFYKLMAICLKICKKNKYFQQVSKLRRKENEMNNTEKNCLIAFKLFSKFSREVMTRLQQFKDDLLASCLEVILSLPIEIVEKEICILIPAVQIALQLGISYLPLAVACLDALESWICILDPNLLKEYYPELLPCLNNYFLVTDNVSFHPLKKIYKIGKQTAVGNKKLSAKYTDNKKIKKTDSYESELIKIQHRILKFLGTLGNQYNAAMICTDEKLLNEVAVAWDIENQNHLKFYLPFIDLKLEMSLDKFLPRIVELSTTASQRHTKITACELLHAVVTFMIGCGAQKQVELQMQFPMNKLYKNILPALLRLACDIDEVARKLFEPFVFQLIHWFTTKRMICSEETMIFVQVIWDGLIQSKDAAFRDFSARCLKEFVQWSIKQTSKKEQEKNPVGIKVILNCLYNYSLHPCPFKRLGAALAFNSIYTFFREEESLIDKFTLEIVIHFIESLAISHYDDKIVGTQEKCKQALNHLEKIMRVKADLLNKPSKYRKPLRNINEVILPNIVEWILRNCGCLQTECRHKCMELVFQLIPYSSNFTAPKDYFNQLLETKTYKFFLTCFEREIASTIPYCNINDGLKPVINWLEGVQTMLDCYCWVFGQAVLQLIDIFNESNNNESKFFSSIQIFLSTLNYEDFDKRIQIFYASDCIGDQVFSPKEKSEYLKISCIIIVRLINFVTIIVEKYNTQLNSAVPPTFWSKNFWNCICLSILNPSVLGFDMTDIDVFDHLPEETGILLKTFCKYLPRALYNDFNEFIYEFLQNKFNIYNLFPLKWNDDSLNAMKTKEMLTGYEQLIENKVWPKQNDKKSKSLAYDILTSIWESCTLETEIGKCVSLLNPSILNMGKKLLTIALKLDIEISDLIEKLLDEEQLFVSSLRSKTKRGLVIFSNYQQEITLFAGINSKDFISCLMNYIKKSNTTIIKILIGILDSIGKIKEIQHKYGKNIINNIILCWSHLHQCLEKINDMDLQNDIITMLTKMLLIDSSFTKDISNPNSHLIFSSFVTILTNETSLEFKISMLDLLPFFCEEYSYKLQNVLDKLSANHFPLQTSELKSGTSQYNDYIRAFSKILIALELTGNEILLKFVIQIMCRESKHLLEEKIHNCFERLCNKIDTNKQKEIVEIPYKMFVQEELYSPDMRIEIIQRVCGALLRIINKISFKDFLKDHIKEIMTIIENKRKDSNQTQLVSKIGSFHLIELLYLRLSKEEIDSCYGGKELTVKATKSANDARKETFRGESIPKEICRKYCCTAYNTIIAIISCTQTSEKFYLAFLFQENFAKGEYIWENIIDLNKEYTFSIEVDTIQERRKKFVSLRKENRSINSDYKSSKNLSSLLYAPSQYLSDSSLSEDVNQFDFTTSELAFSNEIKIKLNKQIETDNELGDEKLINESIVELEVDDLNQHECMNSLTLLVQHMAKIGLISSSPKELPKWLDNICKKLEDHAVHKNIKLFLTKLIVNNAKIFKPYASYLLNPIINLIANETFGTEINFFILDLIIILLSWSSVAIPENSSIGRHAANGLLNFLMKNCFHYRRDVFRNNLETIKTVVELWKERLDIPTNIIYENMKNQNITVKDNIVGIQLFGIMVSNGLDPYQHTMATDKINFLRTLSKNLRNKYKEIYESTAEVCGITMKYYFAKEVNVCEEFCKIVKSEISTNCAKEEQVLICLHKINIHFPSFIDRYFLNKILYMFPRVYGGFKIQILEIIHSHADNVENVFTELKSQGVLNMLEHRDESLQLQSLKIIQKLFQKLELNDLLTIFPLIYKILKNSDTFCREVIYDIMMHAYDKFNTEIGIKEKELYRYAQEMLLYGLAESDLKLRLIVHNFWSQEIHLPIETVPRLIALLQNMYSPATEHMFLQYSTFLLMEMTSRSPDYNLKIFRDPLSTCAFQNYSISSSWRRRHSTLTPLFVESLSMDTVSSNNSMSTENTSAVEHIRSTVDARAFDPTQEPESKKKTFNWLTQTSVDTMGDWESLSSSLSSSSSSSSLLFTIGKGTVRDNMEKFHSKKDVSENKIQKIPSSSTFHLRRRFLKDKEKTRLYFVKLEMRRQQLREEIENEQKKQREGQVTIYRQYRIGDLPDIEINYSSIIVPLQALAQHDDEICRMLFQSLVSAVCYFLKNQQIAEYPEICKNLSNAINNILKKSSQYNSRLVAFCEECLYHDMKEMNIDYEQISIASQASNKQNIGILLFEDYINCRNFIETKSSTKKIKLNKPSISDEISVWIKMAEIYKSVNDYDTVHGIFSNSLNIQQETKRALEFERKGEYLSAIKIYSKLYDQEWSSEEPNQAEIDLWDDAILQCYNCLTQWELLQTNILNRLEDGQERTDLNRIWEEPYYQEHYLPFLIKSKLKLLIENRNDQSLLSFIDAALKEERKKKYLEENFAEELALLFIIQENYDRAQYYSKFCIQEFIKEWSSLNILTPIIRKTNLQCLQKLIELQEFLDFMNTNKIINEQQFKNLVNKWLKRFPNIVDPMNVWDDIIMNRSLYMEKIVSKFQDTNYQQISFSGIDESMDLSSIDESTEFNSENYLKEQRLKMKFRFIEAALHQGNLQIVHKHLKWVQQVAKELKSDHYWISCIHLNCKVDLKKAKNQNYPHQLNTLLEAHKQLAKLELQFPSKLNTSTIKHYLLQSEITEIAADIVMINKLDFEQIEELKNNFSLKSDSKLEDDLFHKSYEYKCRAIDIIQAKNVEISEDDKINISETYLELANFCNKILRMKEEEKILSLSFQYYPSVLINSLLDALKYGNLNAIKLFPRLLQIIEMYPDTIPDFIKKTASIPCWMFLSWINQLITLLDKPEAVAVQNIVKEIGIKFPNALVYPFKLSSECYVFPNTLQGRENKEFVVKLKSCLNQFPLIDDFICALNDLSVPELEFKEYFLKIIQMKKNKNNKNEILKVYEKMCNELFNNKDSRDRIQSGKLHVNIAKKVGPKFFSEFGKDGNKLFSLSLKDLENKYTKILDEIKNNSPKAGKFYLKDLSYWLSEFQSLKYSEAIEIPGQYTGKRKPIPEHHVKICSFDQNVSILSSITKPRCLTIRGNNQNEYRFLVKSGEDLRQDNRIEQLFEVMNDIYQCNSVGSQNKLKLETYQVIPLTTRIGLIEWVDNTKVLGSFLKDAMTDIEKNYDPKETYVKFLASKTNRKEVNFPILYENIYKTSNQEVAKKFSECVNMVPWDLFRRAFLKFSSSLEAFVILRYNFITSHAVLCISQWLLGIGDRHASNFLISTTTGLEIGIDFGHAFGSATQFLPIPELVPFRLTNQYLNLMLPLKEKGIIESTMIAALSALRKNYNILLNTMDIFIKEPTVNWQENALKQKTTLKQKNIVTVVPHPDDDLNWYPKQRILFAKYKLEGINPSHIIKEELILGHSNKSHIQHMVEVCIGDRKSLRRNLPKNGLNTKQQVEVLIDQATDPNVLSRIFLGWEPWL